MRESRIFLLLHALLLAACVGGPSSAPNLSLSDRFELVALRNRDGTQKDELIKWNWPIRVSITGSQTYHREVADHLALLGELTGLQTEMDAAQPNMIIDFSRNSDDAWCKFSIRGRGGRVYSEIIIDTDQSDLEIRICIIQEMTQSLGLVRDLDGRSDTNFTSYGRIDHLTKSDRQLIAILYDDRLRPGMPFDNAMAIVRQIVAEMAVEESLEQ